MIERLALWGPLAPGGAEHWLVRSIAGEWSEATVSGWEYTIGFGPAAGQPGLTLDPDAPVISVAVLTSDRLDRHWRDLDAHLGSGYRRVRAETLSAWIHETDPTAE
ncbi:MAG: hypothetical protein RIB98_02840 [Acidimicrobiales bacterium]